MIIDVHLGFTASIQCEEGGEHKKIENYLIEFIMGFSFIPSHKLGNP